MRPLKVDVVVVGAGSAGCVVARRLLEAGKRVCLLEAGPKDTNPFIHMSAGVAVLGSRPDLSWNYSTVPQAHLNQRQLWSPRGKVLGGSSSVNAMIYIRGQAQDYDDWQRDYGCDGWAYSDCLPYFKKAEQNSRRSSADAEVHGTTGPLGVQDLASPRKLSKAFVSAALACGYRARLDFNDHRPQPVAEVDVQDDSTEHANSAQHSDAEYASYEGAGMYQVTMKGGQRCSAMRGYLTPPPYGNAPADLPLQNLTMLTGALTSHVLRGTGNSAKGVEYIDIASGERRSVEAKERVVLAGGAFNSPHLLQVSGIGNQNHLNGLSRTRAADWDLHLPAVGQHLQDHLDVSLAYRSHAADAFGMSLGFLFRDSPKALWEWLTSSSADRKGMLTSNIAEAGAFLCTDPADPRPDIQLHFLPTMVHNHGQNVLENVLQRPHFQIHSCLLRPTSEGTVMAVSGDPHTAPAIDPQYMSTAEDRQGMLRAVYSAGRIAEAAPLAPYRGERVLPAPEVEGNDAILRYIQDNAETIYHPVGTCRMGPEEAVSGNTTPSTVVSSSTGLVHGTENLHVIDASVMPKLVSGNTNAPTIMIAEKMVDALLREI